MGRFEVDLNIQTKDEIGRLASSFNSMITTIRELIEKNYDIRIRQKEAELYALQSQINPHFIYNTLETISMAVEEGRSDIVVDMVTVLGRMLRFSVGNKSRLVPISDEVQHMRDFLTIQKIRFEDRISVDFDIKTHIDDLNAPKFILQPIVENAVKYGMKTRKVLHIVIAISREFSAHSGKEDVVFRIRDNGPGIEPEKLNALEASLKSRRLDAKDDEFGLSNVNSRIMMLHGSKYGLQLSSIHGKGTEVIIRIPTIQVSDIPGIEESRGGDSFAEN